MVYAELGKNSIQIGATVYIIVAPMKQSPKTGKIYESKAKGDFCVQKCTVQSICFTLCSDGRDNWNPALLLDLGAECLISGTGKTYYRYLNNIRAENCFYTKEEAEAELKRRGWNKK